MKPIQAGGPREAMYVAKTNGPSTGPSGIPELETGPDPAGVKGLRGKIQSRSSAPAAMPLSDGTESRARSGRRHQMQLMDPAK